MSLIEKIKKTYTWRDIKLLIFANSLISLVLFVLDAPWNKSAIVWLQKATYVLLLVQCIGFSIYTILNALPLQRIPYFLIRWPVSLLSTILAGWSGYILGHALITLIFREPFSIHFSMRKIVSLSSQLILFGSLANGFFSLKITIRNYIQKLTEKEIQAEKIERLKIKAELNALRSKVNPHFLFNTLNSIASLIPTDPVRAEELIAQLSGLFRYSLQVADEETIEEELKVVEKYLEIEKVRLGDRLSFEINCDNKCREIKIPGLMIQPLVENSIKHGIAPLPDGGKVQIHCHQNNNHCIILVCDNGKGFSENHKENFGLGGVRERLQLMYGNAHAFSIENLNGVTITLHIPLTIAKDE